MVSFCTKCGEKVTSTFCTACGTPLAAASAPSTAVAASSFVTPASNAAGRGLSTNKGDDWITSGFKKSGYGGSEAETEAVLGAMLNETNRVFGQLGVSVSGERRMKDGPATLCGVCNKPINGAAVQALGKTLHPACFSCSKCHSDLNGDSFVVKTINGVQQPWCDTCVQREKASKPSSNHLKPSEAGIAPFRPAVPSSSGLTASERDEFLSRRDQGKTACAVCGEIMTGDGVTTPSGTSFHVDCFLCSGCGQSIAAGTSFAEREGDVYHPQCAPAPAAGSISCTGCHKPLSGKFVRSSTKDPYHRECFVCAECRTDLGAGYAYRNGKPMCSSCASKNTPNIASSTTVAAANNRDMGGIRYNQVTREVTQVVAPNFVTSPVKNPGETGANASSKWTPTPIATYVPAEKAASSSTAASASASTNTGARFCTGCGFQLGGSKFCPGCGKKAE